MFGVDCSIQRPSVQRRDEECCLAAGRLARGGVLHRLDVFFCHPFVYSDLFLLIIQEYPSTPSPFFKASSHLLQNKLEPYL